MRLLRLLAAALLVWCGSAQLATTTTVLIGSSSSSVESRPHHKKEPSKHVGRAPSCNGCARRESVLHNTMRLGTYSRVLAALGTGNCVLIAVLWAFCAAACARYLIPRHLLVTLFYGLLYFVASPVAILVNKVLMKDYGFGYPVMVSGIGQITTAVVATTLVRMGYVSTENGKAVDRRSLLILGGASALALVLGQYPYLYLTVAFIQMLKAFSPAYMVCFLFCLGVERPSRKVIACIFGLSAFTAVASAGEVNFNLIGVLFMASASCSDALRLVVAQKLLKNMKLGPIETHYFSAPICLLWGRQSHTHTHTHRLTHTSTTASGSHTRTGPASPCPPSSVHR